MPPGGRVRERAKDGKKVSAHRRRQWRKKFWPKQVFFSRSGAKVRAVCSSIQREKDGPIYYLLPADCIASPRIVWGKESTTIREKICTVTLLNISRGKKIGLFSAKPSPKKCKGFFHPNVQDPVAPSVVSLFSFGRDKTESDSDWLSGVIATNYIHHRRDTDYCAHTFCFLSQNKVRTKNALKTRSGAVDPRGFGFTLQQIKNRIKTR